MMSSIKHLACAAALSIGLLAPLTAYARYVADTAAAPNGTVDLRAYGAHRFPSPRSIPA